MSRHPAVARTVAPARAASRGTASRRAAPADACRPAPVPAATSANPAGPARTAGSGHAAGSTRTAGPAHAAGAGPVRARHRRRPVEPNVLDVARRAFGVLVTGPDPLAVDGRQIAGLPDEAVVPLSRVRDLLLARSCPQATRDRVWAELVTRSRATGGAWTVGCVGMALPALTRITAQLTARFTDDPADIAAATLTGFLSALPTVDLDRPRIMLRLRWAAYRGGHAALIEALDAPLPVAPKFGSLAPLPPWGHPDLVLAGLVAEGVISPAEAEVIGATRLEQTAVADWASAHGMGTWAVYKMRQRAEHKVASRLLDAPPPPRRTPAPRPTIPAEVTDTAAAAAAGAGVAGGAERAGVGPVGAAGRGLLSNAPAAPGLQLHRQPSPVYPAPKDPRCA